MYIGEITGTGKSLDEYQVLVAFRNEPIPSFKVGRSIAISDRYYPDCFLEDCGQRRKTFALGTGFT